MRAARRTLPLLGLALALAGCSTADDPTVTPDYYPIEPILNDSDGFNLLTASRRQEITGSQDFSLKESFGYGHEVEMEGTGSVDVAIDVYPFYAFEGCDSSGDYYLVEAAVTVHSEKMWGDSKFTYYSKESDDLYFYPQQVYAFYLKSLDLECSLLDADGNVVGEFPAGNFPTPQTTVESTTYVTGFTVGVSVEVKVGIEGEAVYAEARIKPQLTIDNRAERHMPALEIMNKSDSQTPSFSFMPNSSISDDNITPLDQAIGNVTYYQSWLWRVPGTTDSSTQSFKLRYKTSETYSGFSAGNDVLHPYTIYTPKDDVVEQEVVVVDLTPPSRVPMGQLSIENREDGRVFVTDINVYKTGTDTLVANSGDNVYAPGDEFSAWLDVGDYDITFSKGSSDDSMQTYKYSKGVLSIVRDQEVHIYTDYYFDLK